MYMTTQGIFMHNGKFYKQLDETSMGSPLGPTLANFFLGRLEKKIFDDETIDLPTLYLRYIDDVNAVFENESTCKKFLKVLNSKHENVRFTMEKSTDARTITFSDVQIELNESGYNTWVWPKPTNTGLLFNFDANCPQTWKSSLILCLLHHAKNLL